MKHDYFFKRNLNPKLCSLEGRGRNATRTDIYESSRDRVRMSILATCPEAEFEVGVISYTRNPSSMLKDGVCWD